MILANNNGKLTIDDVAKLAGVSRATAGRVVGGYGSVSPETREKVTQAVKTLNFRPNAIAQGLRSQNTKTIAVVLGNIKNNYCNALVFAIEEEAMKRGYNVLICNTNEQVEKELNHLQNIYSKQVDGVILTSAYTADHHIPDELRHLYDGDVPVVFVDRKIKGFEIELVQSNNEESSYRATRYLLSMGHRRIGIIGTRDYSTVRERVSGYKRALRLAGMEVDDSLIVDAEYAQVNAGQDLTAKLLDRHRDITALYILNNTLCGGVLLELKRRGLRTPEDLSLLTWDDEEMNELFDLTTVAQPVEETGRMATQRLLELIEYPEHRANRRVVQLETEIRYRKSCAKPR